MFDNKVKNILLFSLLKALNPRCTVAQLDCSSQILLEEMPYGIYQVCGSGSTSWYGFAKKIFELCGFDVNLKPCTTEEFPRIAKMKIVVFFDILIYNTYMNV